MTTGDAGVVEMLAFFKGFVLAETDWDDDTETAGERIRFATGTGASKGIELWL